MRLTFLLAFVALSACATQNVVSSNVVSSSGRAFFSEYPDMLIAAFESACASPTQSFSRPEPGMVECRKLLSPEATAAIILNFDGTPEALPELVIRFRTSPEAPGYLVENDVFLHVPQKSGPARVLRKPDAQLSRTLQSLYLRSGGVPE